MTIMDIQFFILFAPTLALLAFAVWEDWNSNNTNRGNDEIV